MNANPLQDRETSVADTISGLLTKRPDGPVVLAGRYQVVRKP